MSGLAWRSEALVELDQIAPVELLAAHLAARAADEFLLVTLPAPAAGPERLWELGDGPAFLWDPPGGPSQAGLGSGVEIALATGQGPAELRRRADAVFARLRQEAHPAAAAVRPRFFGGFAFEAGAADGAPWQELGDGLFRLPKFLYERAGDLATLSVLAPAGGDRASDAELVEQTARILAGLGEAGMPSVARLPRPTLQAERDEDYVARVSAIVEAIGRGELEKVVAARHRVVELPGADPVAILRRLGVGRRASTRFGFRRGKITFLGATPERLVRKMGAQLETEALAGSSRSGRDAALLQSGKDLREHQLVVDDILARLRPLCATLNAPAQPTVRELRDVLHLLTPITGRLSSPRHVLELVDELHPTPAVAGVPTPAAVDWIREHEPFARGWYASPIGYFDAAGDGDFAVALRSCVVEGDGKVHLFAGAGIMGDSLPEAELAETELKQQALLAALAG